MALAKSFDKDIFISYCHTDNDDLGGEGWIELFHKSLRSRLVQLLGARVPEEEPSIWRDNRLQGNHEFADVLADELRKVALVVSVMSPSYIKSDWCRREIKAFCDAAATRGGIVVGGNKGRLLKVLKDPVPPDDQPEEVKGQIGFQFYTTDTERKWPIPFTLTKGDDTNAKAKLVIDDLAHSIIATITAVNEIPVASAATAPALMPATVTPAAGTVFLAECELDEERQQLRRALEDMGVTVLPAGDLPGRRPEEFKQTVRDALARCDVSVHMVAATRSRVLRGEVEDTVYLQNELAAERSANGSLRRLIWLPPGLEISQDDARQQAFVGRLQRDPAAQQGAEVLTVPLQGLIAQTHNLLKKQRGAKEQPARVETNDTPACVYLIFDPKDNERVDPLKQYLLDQGFDVIERVSDPTATSEDLQADHKQNLIQADAAIVYLGSAGELWAKALLSDVQKCGGWPDKQTPLRAKAIYLGEPGEAPANSYKQNYLRKVGFVSLDGRTGFSPAAVSPFIAGLKQTAGVAR
jgi:TIR domain